MMSTINAAETLPVQRRTARLLRHLRPKSAAGSAAASAAELVVPKVEMAPGGPLVSELICGMMRFTSGDASYTPAQTLGVLKECLAMGVTTFDVAAVYGGGEAKRGVEHNFGEALALEPGLRERLEIVTKCGIRNVEGQALYDTSTEHILESVQKSLRALRTGYIDVLLIHRPDPTMDADAVAEAFTQLNAAGTVRHFGVSNFTPSQVELLQSRLGSNISLVTNQLEISCLETKLLSSPFGDGTLDQCQLARARPMAWSPLNKLLSGGQGGSDARTQRVLAAVRDVATELGLPDSDEGVTAVAVAWIRFLPCAPLVVTGVRRTVVHTWNHRCAACRRMTMRA